MPNGSVTIDVSRNFSYKMAGNYCGFHAAGVTSPFALADMPLQDLSGSNVLAPLSF
jgi:hypothetical protein